MDRQQLLTTVVYPTMALFLTGVIPIGLAWIARKLGVQAAAAQDQAAATRDHAANVAVQGAVATFAGKVVGDIADGKLTAADVRSGAAARDLVDYAASTVGDSMLRLGVTPETLSSMMVGRVGALLAPAAPGAAAQDAASAPGPAAAPG